MVMGCNLKKGSVVVGVGVGVGGGRRGGGGGGEGGGDGSGESGGGPKMGRFGRERGGRNVSKSSTIERRWVW